MKISIGGDHAGYELKESIKNHLISMRHSVEDFGPQNEESCDYADIAHPLAKSVQQKQSDRAIAICGSGNGINMTLNKHAQIRSALCWNSEIVKLARSHNDANIMALPARFITKEEAIGFVELFINTEFEGGRHLRRINKIDIKE